MMEHEFDKIELLSYFTGDITGGKRGAMERHIASCGQCRAYLASLESEKAAFLQAHPFEETAARWNTRQAGRRVFFRHRQVYALAASLILFLGAGYLFMAGRTETGYRIKGETNLKIFVKNHAGDIEKRGRQEYFTGEKIQFLYSCGAKNNFALISMDTTGAVSIYFPQSEDSSLALERGRDIPLPNSIALDEYAGRELFMGIFSEKQFFVPQLVERLKTSFGRSHSIDSIGIAEKDFITVTYSLTVQQGKR
jgi:hypothetical protein